MNAIRHAIRPGRSQSGQSIYQTLLIISCVALALALFFPTYEYFDYYHGPGRYPRFGGAGGTAYTPSAPAPRPAPASAAPTTTLAPGAPASEAPEPVTPPAAAPKPGAPGARQDGSRGDLRVASLAPAGRSANWPLSPLRVVDPAQR
jgi:hypothetical protein